MLQKNNIIVSDIEYLFYLRYVWYIWI